MKIKIACNYYPETEQLVDEKVIDIDYFKLFALGFQMALAENLDEFEIFCEKLTVKRPILLHGLGSLPHDLSSPTFQTDFDKDEANRLIKMTKTPGLSFHPTFTEKDFSFDNIVSNAKFIKEKYSHMEFVSIENMDSLRWGDLIKPDVIHRLLDETGYGFLLDISHAYCASRWLDIPFRSYLKMLPLEKVTEIHINGWIVKDNKIMCHTKINDEGYAALEEVLQYCVPQIITVEYGRDYDKFDIGIPLISPDSINERAKDEITEQIQKIKQLIYNIS
ncbi:MAG: DUF692 family protein [Oscillospiraceae bacterium]|nr:DUF692 family protein [Oscillospiraceae bacterium]